MAKITSTNILPPSQILYKDLRQLARDMEENKRFYDITGNVNRFAFLMNAKDLTGRETFNPNEYISDLVSTAKLESDHYYRIQALLFLHTIGTTEAEVALTKSLKSEEIPLSVRHKVAQELVKMNDRRALRVLKDSLKVLEVTPFLGNKLTEKVVALERKLFPMSTT